MRTLPVTFRPEALDDLEDAFLYTLEKSQHIGTAVGYAERIRARCLSIGDAPHGGRPRNDLFPGLRTIPFERSAVITYVVEDDRVRIFNIFVGGRDYETIMQSRQEGE